MTSIAVTGANGFLGWHTRCAARARGIESRTIAVGDHFDPIAAIRALRGAERVIHIAGVNRASSDREVFDGNLRFAEQLAGSVMKTDEPPRLIVFANTTQAGNRTPYGESKGRAAEILEEASRAVGATFLDVKLPNLFGEHGKPFYNSVVATFCELLARGEAPTVIQDRQLELLHAQNAADILLGNSPLAHSHVVQRTVREILERLRLFSELYGHGEIPNITNDFERDLFNTYRSFTFAAQTPVALTPHSDSRGDFFEITRTHGGTTQSSFSTTRSGVSRGDHFHLRKIERFTVLSGHAVISLRRLYSEEVFAFNVDGDHPQAVDMPTMWAHKIQNVGDADLFTSFWSNEIFDPKAPDTYAEEV